jgi:hypothetical protein
MTAIARTGALAATFGVERPQRFRAQRSPLRAPNQRFYRGLRE